MPIPSSILIWLQQILSERFGHDFKLVANTQGVRLCLQESEDFIEIRSNIGTFLRLGSDLPCAEWSGSEEGWNVVLETAIPAPGVLQLPEPLIEKRNHGFYIHYDILGLTYWMLSRQEEVEREDLDAHGRFPAVNSHAYKYGYLERPIVDEWLHVLGQVVNRLWPNLTIKKHHFEMRVSHDVDQPSQYAFKPWRTIGRMMAGHLLKRRDIKSFFLAPYIKFKTAERLQLRDPYNTFDWLMDISESNNLKSAFYFICGRTSELLDGDYDLEHPAIRNLLRKIYERGHEIGVHPSYATYQNPELIRHEVERLWRVCEEEDIRQKIWGGRMHYLRWEQPITLQAWNDAGLNYDSTLGYADFPGFRCGTSFSYPAFNPISQRVLKLRIRPLIVMEGTVIDSTYLGLGVTKEAEYRLLTLKDRCRAVSGTFSLLWHNSYFYNDENLRYLYRRCLEG